MTELAGWDRVAAAAVSGALNGVWLGTLLVIGVWAVMHLLAYRRSINATTRYLVWSATLVLSAGILLQSIGQDYQGQARTAVVVQTDAPAPPSQRALIAPLLPDQALDAVMPSSSDTAGPIAESSGNPAVPRIEGPAIGLVWRRVLFGLWAFVTLVMVLRIAIGFAAAGRIKRRGRPAADHLQHMMRRVLAQTGATRPIRLAVSDEVDTALAIGFRSPAILVPQTMLGMLDETELEQVLLHETAHLIRRDDFALVCQRLAEAAFFFHPAVFFLGRWMSRDREIAADDWVVTLTRRPKAYAACLVKLTGLRRQSMAMVPGFAAGKKQLVDRVTTLLDRRRLATRQVSMAVLLILLCGVCVMAGATLRLVPVFVLPLGESVLETLGVALPPAAAIEVAGRGAEVPAPVAWSSAVSVSSTDMAPDPAPDPAMPRSAGVAAVSPAPMAESEPLAEVVLFPEPTLAAAASQQSNADPVLSAASMRKLLLASTHIASSGDRAQVLLEAVRRLPEDASVYLAYIETAATIPSSGDRASTLLGLIEQHALDVTVARSFLAAAGGIPSMGDRASVLERVVDSEALPMSDAGVREAYLEAIETLPSDAFKRISTALLRRQR